MRRAVLVVLAACAIAASPLAARATAKEIQVAPSEPIDVRTEPAPAVSFARLDLRVGALAGAATRDGGTITLGGGSGTWTSPWTPAGFAFDELVASWNTTTPEHTWVTIKMRATRTGRPPTKWYTLGIWTSAADPAHRTSVRGQGDADGDVAVDTFVRATSAAAIDTFQIEVGLHRDATTTAAPAVRSLGVMTSARSEYAIPSPPAGVVADLGVPAYSQEVHAGHFPQYDGGGEAWCSPTSTAMVLDFWARGPDATERAAFPGAAHLDGQVDHTARAVYDWSYRGAGNWSFNTAYAAERGLAAFVTRLRSLAEAERFVAAGIPLVASVSGHLPGFYFTSTEGHLLTIVGFTRAGDVISNDPAMPSDAAVRKVYARADFEQVWLRGSGGIVYVIHPEGMELPEPRDATLPRNW